MQKLEIKSYKDIEKVKDLKENVFIVNLENCISKHKERVIDFLCGLTFSNGSMRKLNNSEYEIIKNITYYEEIYSNNKFKEKVIDFYKDGLKEKNPYKDPDTTYGECEGSLYYKNIEKFLKIQFSNFTYIYPKSQNDFITNNQDYLSSYIKIHQFDENDIIDDSKKNKKFPPYCIADINNMLFLRTDQFGFSFFDGTAKDNVHPYGKYFNLIKENQKIKDEDLLFIADCINTTRTIGGSFIWPIVKNGNFHSEYNKKRGITCYIEDSVDLTLNEIKEFYLLFEKYEDDYNTIKKEMDEKNYVLLKQIDAKDIYKWLSYFKTFKNYIDKFCFQPFVDEDYNIIDITRAKITTDTDYGYCTSEEILNSDKISKYQEAKRLESIQDKEKLKQVLNNVRWLTIKRTVEMERIINN